MALAGCWGRWPLGVARLYYGEHWPVWLPCSLWAVRGREPKPAASKAWRHGRHYSPQHSYGPGLCPVSTSALFARFYSPPLVCCSHVHTTSMVRWSDPDRSMSDPLDERPVERGDSPGNLPRSLVVLIPSLSSRREPR